MSESPITDSSESPARFFDGKPVTVAYAYQMPEKYGCRWGCTAKNGEGRNKYFELSISSTGCVCVTGGNDLVRENRPKELFLKKISDEANDDTPRHCDILRQLEDEMRFEPEIVLHWAILDLDPEYVGKALAAGVSLRKEVVDGIHPLDLVSAVSATLSETFLRHFRDDSQPDEVLRIVSDPWNANYQARALLIKQMLLEAGAPDHCAFRWAVRQGKFDHASAELLAGVSVDACAPGGEVPLVEALLRKDLRAVRWLLRNGADRHAQTGFRSEWVPAIDNIIAEKLIAPERVLSPLVAACVVDFPEGFRALLEYREDRPDSKDFECMLGSCVPPDWALEALAKSGFDFSLIENPPFKKWLDREGAGVSDSIRKLIALAGKEVFCHKMFRDEDHPLQYFCEKPESPGRIEVLRILLESGISPNPLSPRPEKSVYETSLDDMNCTDEEKARERQQRLDYRMLCVGSPPLHCAVHAGNAGVEALLLEFGANPDVLDALGRKPEAFRKQKDDPQNDSAGRRCARFLQDLECERNPRSWAAEHAPDLLAASAEDESALLDLMERWLDKGGDPKPHNLLVRAVDFNSPHLVELLLRSDCDHQQMGYALLAAMDTADQLSSQAHDFWIYRGSLRDPGPPEGYRESGAAICKLLRDAGARDFTRLPAAARSGDLAGIKAESEAGTPVNFLADGWGSPLLAAISGNQPAAVRVLLDAGADPNLHFDSQAPDSVEISPCQAALKTGNAAIVKDLLQAGADLDKGGEVCANLFTCAIKDSETAAMLFDGRKAFPDWKNSAGETGVHLLDRESLRVCREFIPTEALDVRSYRGETPVLRAVQCGDIGKAFDLLDAGAAPACYGALNHDGIFTPGSYYSKANHLNVFCLNPMHAAILSGNILFVERMLETGGRFDLPAFAVPQAPSQEGRARLRATLDGYWPREFPQDPCWRKSFEEDFMMRGMHNVPRIPELPTNESLLLLHFLMENPGRAAAFREFVVPLSCLDLAAEMGSAVMREMVLSGRNLEGGAFFTALRGDIASLAEVLREEQRLLLDPDADRPRTYPYILKIREIESALIAKVWEATGEMLPLADKDSAMDCLRYASDEFDGKFLECMEKLEETGRLSMDEFVGGLAEALDPGSTVDLGKFFKMSLATLSGFDGVCRQYGG